MTRTEYNPWEVDELSDAELIDEFKDAYDTIEVFECFGKTDLIRYYSLMGEVRRRGLDIRLKMEVC